MHWAYKIAEELINKYPDKETFVCASGISPSGSVHIGNFREVITTYFVVKALRKLGKKTRFIFSWDDYDRFRKVPKNIDQSFKKYIGKPYSEIPDPYGCHRSYAEHFEREFEQSLEAFGIEAEFIYQSKEYKRGRYNGNILHALRQRKEIYDILMEFKTQEPTEEDRNSFYTITLYCDDCGRDNIDIINFDEKRESIQYLCKCGNDRTMSVMDARNIKLNWKIDWPMRWMVEDVIFEPGGRDHSSATGSYNVSKEIARRIFKYREPDYVAYEFIGIKGSKAKMSSSMGNIITPDELLKIYLPEIILFIFSKYRPGAAFNIGLDEDVIRNYSEYERLKSRHLNGLLGDEDLSYSIELARIDNRDTTLPKFNQVAGVLPLVDFDVQVLKEVLNRVDEDYNLTHIKEISDRVEYWIRNWCTERIISINTSKDVEYYETLDNIQKKWLTDLCIVIENSQDLGSDELMKRIYDVCHDNDRKVKRNNQRVLFPIVYRLTLNSTNGPRLPLLIKSLGIERSLYLLDFNK